MPNVNISFDCLQSAYTTFKTNMRRSPRERVSTYGFVVCRTLRVRDCRDSDWPARDVHRAWHCRTGQLVNENNIKKKLHTHASKHKRAFGPVSTAVHASIYSNRFVFVAFICRGDLQSIHAPGYCKAPAGPRLAHPPPLPNPHPPIHPPDPIIRQGVCHIPYLSQSRKNMCRKVSSHSHARFTAVK